VDPLKLAALAVARGVHIGVEVGNDLRVVAVEVVLQLGDSLLVARNDR
jgi:hypothetical protein